MIKEVTVEYQRFQTRDGMLFEKREDAKHHEKVLNGTIKTCPRCEGAKKLDAYGDGRQWMTCNSCSGKGYVEKCEVWQ